MVDPRQVKTRSRRHERKNESKRKPNQVKEIPRDNRKKAI
jgi:hypothetical protein